MTNNAKITVNLLPNNLGSIPIPESFDSRVYGKLCDVLTSLRLPEVRSQDANNAFRVWHNVIAEAAVQAAYLPERTKSRSVSEELHTMLKGSLGISELLDLNHELLLTVDGGRELEGPSMVPLGSYTDDKSLTQRKQT